MVLDPISATQTATRAERPDATVAANEPERVRPERPEAGQTSEAASAVVANLSAAAKETARPVNEAQQAADESRAREAVQAAEQRVRDQQDAAANAARAQEKARSSRLDVVV